MLPFALVILSATAAPPLDHVIKEAALAGRPIVLYVGTKWCKPCLLMDKEVFPDPRVQAELAGVAFQKYDAEEGAGVEVRERFSITAYPTVLVLSPDEVQVGTISAQDPDGFLEELKALRPLAATRGPFTEAALSERKAPAAAWYVAALQARTATPKDAALIGRLLGKARDLDSTNATGVGVRAALDLARLKLEDASRKAQVELLVELASRFPGTAEAGQCLEWLAAQPSLTPAEGARVKQAARTSAEALAAAKKVGPLNDIIYVQLALLDSEGALKSAERLKGLTEDPLVLDTVAETYFQSGRRDQAVAFEEQLAAKAPPGSLADNLRRFREEAPKPPSLHPKLDLTSGGPAQAEEGPSPALMAEFGETMFAGSTLAEACRARAGKTVSTYVRLKFANRKLVKAVAFDLEAPAALRSCLEAAARKLELKTISKNASWDVKVTLAEDPGTMMIQR